MASFACPITLSLMEDPVILGFSGQSYERKAIEEWLETHDTDPISNVKLAHRERALVPNIALRNAIDDYKNEHVKTDSVAKEITNCTRSIAKYTILEPEHKTPSKKSALAMTKNATRKTPSAKIVKSKNFLVVRKNSSFYCLPLFISGIVGLIFVIMISSSISSNNQNPVQHTIKRERKLVYPDGEVYEGEVLNEKAHGLGKFIYTEGSVYEGRLYQGLRHGHGVLKTPLPSGKMFVSAGNWVKDKLHGEGVIEYGDGNVYRGMTKDGERHGYGLYTFRDGSTMSGPWTSGFLNGQGVLTTSEGNTYEGELLNTVKHGFGTLTYFDGTVFKGFFANDFPNGQGEQTKPGDYFYKGQFTDGQMTGYGVMVRSGMTYEGVFERGRPLGEVKVTTSEGHTYRGDVHDGAGLLVNTFETCVK